MLRIMGERTSAEIKDIPCYRISPLEQQRNATSFGHLNLQIRQLSAAVNALMEGAASHRQYDRSPQRKRTIPTLGCDRASQERQPHLRAPNQELT